MAICYEVYNIGRSKICDNCIKMSGEIKIYCGMGLTLYVKWFNIILWQAVISCLL